MFKTRFTFQFPADPFHFWIGLAVCLACAACATTGDKDPLAKYPSTKLHEMGERFLAAGDYTNALKFLLAADQKKPDDPVINYELGLAFDERGIQNEALARFNKAVALKPDYSDAYNALGRFYGRQGNYEMALASFQKALANPFYQNPQLVRYNLGLLYEAKSNPEEALKQYQEAVRLQPSYGVAYYRMGRAWEEMKRADEAKRAYVKAIQHSPDLAEAHLRYGIMCYTAGEMEDALYSLNRVVRLAPNTSLADEARLYIQRLQGILGHPMHLNASPPLPSEKIDQMEVVKKEDLNGATVTEASVTAPAYALLQSKSEYHVAMRQLFPETAPPSKACLPPADVATETSAPPVVQWTYIVQVRSFLDPGNAEKLAQRLNARGYQAMIKPFRHQILGSIHVVQLKPLEDENKAVHLVSQVDREYDANPVLIKVPSEY